MIWDGNKQLDPSLHVGVTRTKRSFTPYVTRAGYARTMRTYERNVNIPYSHNSESRYASKPTI